MNETRVEIISSDGPITPDTPIPEKLNPDNHLLTEMPLSWAILRMVLPTGYQVQESGKVVVVGDPSIVYPCAFATNGPNVLFLTPAQFEANDSVKLPGEATNNQLAKGATNLFVFNDDHNLMFLAASAQHAEENLGLIFNW
jgi:hypothetical protein